MNATNQSPASTAADAHVEKLHQIILKCLEDGQAEEVVSIPLAGKSAIADHLVIASGRSTRQVASMAQKLADLRQGRPSAQKLRCHRVAQAMCVDAPEVGSPGGIRHDAAHPA